MKLRCHRNGCWVCVLCSVIRQHFVVIIGLCIVLIRWCFSKFLIVSEHINFFCNQEREERIGDVVRMRMNLRKGSWCLKRMDKVCWNTLVYNEFSLLFKTWSAFGCILLFSSSRICSGHQDVGKWEVGGHVFWWSQAALSHPRKAPEKGALYRSSLWCFRLNADSAFPSLCEWDWLCGLTEMVRPISQYCLMNLSNVTNFNCGKFQQRTKFCFSGFSLNPKMFVLLEVLCLHLSLI